MTRVDVRASAPPAVRVLRAPARGLRAPARGLVASAPLHLARAFAAALAVAVVASAACSATAPTATPGASSTAEVGAGPNASAPPVAFEPPSAETRCASGDASACATVADGVRESDRARAAELYARSCEGGSAYGCARGAALVQPGDPARAAAMMRAGCDAGFDTSCNDLGFAAEHGVGVPVDPALALSLYARSCASGGAFGCFNQGIFVETGRGGAPPDLEGGARLYGVACDMKYDHACAALARMLYLGKGVAEDRPRAIALLRTSCQGGYAFACDFITRHGIETPAP